MASGKEMRDHSTRVVVCALVAEQYGLLGCTSWIGHSKSRSSVFLFSENFEMLSCFTDRVQRDYSYN